MGSWGVKALESDEGLDVYDFLRDFWGKPEKIDLSDAVNQLTKDGWLPEEPPVEDYIFDHAAMVICELLLEYLENGKLVYYLLDDNYNEEEVIVENVSYDRASFEPALIQLKAIMDKDTELHEIYEIWSESDDFCEWEAHVQNLISVVTNL